MTGWESVRADLRQLRDESPAALIVFPDPDGEQHLRPGQRISIDQVAWATDIAAMLNTKYGGLLDLHVGAMTFPTRQLWAVVSEYQREWAGGG